MPPNQPSEFRPHSISFHIVLAAALLVFILTFDVLAPILLSLLLILLISLAVNPVISRLRALTGGRRGATALVVVALVTVIGLSGWALFVPMKSSVTKLSEQLPVYWERLQKPLIRMEQKAERSEEKLQSEVTTEIAQEAEDEGRTKSPPQTIKPASPESVNESTSIRTGITQMLHGVFGRFTDVAFDAAQILVVLVTVLFGVIFTLMNPHPIFRVMFSLAPERHHNRILRILQRIGSFVPRWAGATLLGMLAIGLLVFVIMWPIFGVMDALVLGLIAGMFEAVPFIGPVLSAVPALLLALAKGGMTPLWVVIAYFAIQAVENNVIIPFIMARGMKLHPVAVIFSMLLCVAVFGVLGVLVAAPLVAIIGILYDELFRKRYLPTVTDADLDGLARRALYEKIPEKG